MTHKMALTWDGKGLVRNGVSMLESARCCCLCDCIGETVEITYPNLTDGEAAIPNILPCDPCDQAGQTLTLTHSASGTIGTGEGAYDYCTFEVAAGFPTEPDCQIHKARLYVTTTGGTWTTKTGIELSLQLLDANDEVVAEWSLSLTCEEINEQMPGALTLIASDAFDCESTDATVTVTGSGCCTECLACGSELLVAREPLLLTVSTLVDGTGAEGFRCTRCDEISFTDQPIEYVTTDGTCVYEYYLDPRPDPAASPIDDDAFGEKCSAYVVRVNVNNYLDGGLAKKTNIQIRIYGSCDDGGGGTVDECFLIAEWIDTALDGWHGTYTVPFAGSGSEFCLPNDTTPDATIVLPCNTEPPA